MSQENPNKIPIDYNEQPEEGVERVHPEETPTPPEDLLDVSNVANEDLMGLYGRNALLRKLLSAQEDATAKAEINAALEIVRAEIKAKGGDDSNEMGLAA